VGSAGSRVKGKSERKAVPCIHVYLYTESAEVGRRGMKRRGMKRGDFPSAVYVVFLLPVAAAVPSPSASPPPSPPPSPGRAVENGPNRARRVLITNNYEC